MYTEEYLDEASNTLRLLAHQTATYLQSLSTAWYGPPKAPASSMSLMWWCSVDSSSHAELSFEQLQSVGRDHLCCNCSHQDMNSVTLWVVLGFALAGQLVQMPAAAHSIPKILRYYCITFSRKI
jgi:hypothetical protein